jgi:arsenate reductase (glutaredoxin)
MYTIYHNPRCKVSRSVLEELKLTNQPVEVVEYMSNKLTAKELNKLLNELHLAPQEIIRKNEELYKKEYKGKTFSNEEWVHILVTNPKLIERPIVKKGYSAIVCRPMELVKEIITD